MTSQLDVALIRKLRGSMMYLALFYNVILGCSCNQALVDNRSTGTGINCLYYVLVWFVSRFLPRLFVFVFRTENLCTISSPVDCLT